MKLRIDTPLTTVVDEDGVLSLRAEDASGSFGILPHHATFLTSLAISVVSWKSADGAQRCCAVRRGVFAVTPARDIAIATREAIVGDDIATLEDTVLTRFKAEIETDKTERVDSTRLQLRAIREIMRHLQTSGPASRLFLVTAPESDPTRTDPLLESIRLRGDRHAASLRDGEPSVARRLSQIGVLGWIVVVPMLLGVFAGRWLDQHFQSGLMFTAPLLMLGAALGCWSAWKWTQTA